MEEARLTYAEKTLKLSLLEGDPIEQIIDGSLGEDLTSNEIEFLSDIGDIDFVVGGPPCQGHSDLNNSFKER